MNDLVWIWPIKPKPITPTFARSFAPKTRLAESRDEEKRTQQVGINQDRATANAAKTAAALQEFFKPHFVGRIDSQALEHASGHTFGLAGSDADKLGTHEVAVIFVP